MIKVLKKSALDSKSERLVQETINNVIKGHTVINNKLLFWSIIFFILTF